MTESVGNPGFLVKIGITMFFHNFRLSATKIDRLLTFLICKVYPPDNLNLSHVTVDISVIITSVMPT